jgi:hypothetical protein
MGTRTMSDEVLGAELSTALVCTLEKDPLAAFGVAKTLLSEDHSGLASFLCYKATEQLLKEASSKKLK